MRTLIVLLLGPLAALLAIQASAQTARSALSGAGQAQQDTSSEDHSSDAINSKTIGELPLNGRSTSDVAALEPGVFKARTQAQGDGRYGYGTQMVIFGGRPRENNSRLDGVSVNDYANGPLGNAVGIALGVDALEQLQDPILGFPP